MTILEFIRKNSILVIIVIFGVGAGLVMMDYSGKGSAFSRDFYIKVNGTGYSYSEAATLGENGRHVLVGLRQAMNDKLLEKFDADGNGQLDEQEMPKLQNWRMTNPEFEECFDALYSIYNAWASGACREEADNIAISRAMLKAEAEELGLRPSESQIDDYLRSLFPFKKDDGSFNTELYQQLTGQRHGKANRVQEELFRDVIADIISWQSLKSLVIDAVSYNTKVQTKTIDAFNQHVKGRTALLPASAVPTPADPSEEELRAWWEQHKEAYKSDERRIVSVYTLSPSGDSNMENLMIMADSLMQELSLANGQGLDKLLTDAANNPEYDPFNYLLEDGSTHHTYPLTDKKGLKEILTDVVNYNGTDTGLAEVAFAEVTEAPGVDSYKAAVEAGTEDKIVNIKQIRGPYTTEGDKLKLLRVEAIEAPVVLPYEEARSKALADFRAERADAALKETAEKLYKEMDATIAEQGLEAAFTMATEAGAQVESYDAYSVQLADLELPAGVTIENILSTHSGHLTPLIFMSDGARITSVDERSIEDSTRQTLQRYEALIAHNRMLRNNMMLDWKVSAYTRFNVLLSEHVRRITTSDTTED